MDVGFCRSKSNPQWRGPLQSQYVKRLLSEFQSAFLSSSFCPIHSLSPPPLSLAAAAAARVEKMHAGWPLGLDNMNMRLRLMDASEAASIRADTFDIPSISSSSFSSSDLGTESSRSFFRDHSMTLGRLIGIKPGEGELYFPNQSRHEQHSRESTARAAPHASDRHEMEACHGICIPLILCILVKANRSRNSSKTLEQAN